MAIKRTMKTIVAAIAAGVRECGRVSAEPEVGFAPMAALRGINRAAKLTEEDIREIRRLRAAGHKLKTIAAKFNITEANVSYIAKGKGWKHVI